MARQDTARRGKARQGEAERGMAINLHHNKESEMEDQFRESVVKLASKSLGVMEDYMDGKTSGSDKIRHAGSNIALGVKVSHMDQIGEQVKRSQALRLLNHIPKERRAEYIGITNPEAKPFLLAKPSKR